MSPKSLLCELVILRELGSRISRSIISKTSGRRAIVVVGDEENKSKTMDTALQDAIDNSGSQAR
jgi:hypothetical protein